MQLVHVRFQHWSIQTLEIGWKIYFPFVAELNKMCWFVSAAATSETKPTKNDTSIFITTEVMAVFFLTGLTPTYVHLCSHLNMFTFEFFTD